VNTPAITGRTRVVGVIGWPVEHSLSPPMHNAEFARLKLDWAYVAWPVPPAGLADAVRGLRALGVAGFNATIPHKQALLPLLDEMTEEARLIGAVNTVHFTDGRAVGHNTDAAGWAADAGREARLAGSTVFVIGAGGAARAVAVGACTAGAARVVVGARRREPADELAAALRGQFPRVEADAAALDDASCRDLFRGCAVAVNATPVGMDAHPGIPVPETWLRAGQFLYDTVYTPAETRLVHAARRAGCRVRGGAGMLARQGAEAFRIWTGVAPDALRMEQILLAALAQR
jgi:shikimate dehydrogenase